MRPCSHLVRRWRSALPGTLCREPLGCRWTKPCVLNRDRSTISDKPPISPKAPPHSGRSVHRDLRVADPQQKKVKKKTKGENKRRVFVRGLLPTSAVLCSATAVFGQE